MKASYQELCVMAENGALPDGFNNYQATDNNGWSVAHQAAKFSKLPQEFPLWHLRDNKGISVAEVAFIHGNLPDGFDWAYAQTVRLSSNADRDRDMRLARALNDVVSGSTYSGDVLQRSIERLTEIKQAGPYDDYISVQNLSDAIAYLKLAKKGVSDIHGAGEAPVLIATYAERYSAINVDQAYQSQIKGLKVMSDGLDEVLRPAANMRDFEHKTLQDFAHDHGFVVESIVDLGDEMAQKAVLVRGGSNDPLQQKIDLLLSSDGQFVSGKGYLVSMADSSEYVLHHNVLGALDRAVNAIDKMVAKNLIAENDSYCSGPEI